jgi:outer membrane protein TolC
MKRATRLEIVEVLPVLRGLGLLLLSCLTLVACTVGPDYETPELEQEVPDAWKSAAAEEVEGDGSPLATWWTTLNDPKLVELIGEARQSNLSVQIAAARVEAARARLGVATGRYYPDVIVDASYSRNRPSENSAQFVPPEGFEDFSLYNIGVGFDWEIDVFGRLRRGAESARAGLEASIEDYRDVMVILMADVAANYVDVRTFQDRIKYLQANVEAQSESLQLTQDRFDAGLSPLTDVTQAEYNLVDDLVASDPGIPDPNDTVALGIPAELLRRRPDIRAAERRLASQTARIGVLASQTARIGVAKADLYPTFSLAGILTLESFTSSNLFESESTGWSLVPGVRWNIFSGGRIRSQVQVQEALTQALLFSYEQSVLFALDEVESTMVAYERQKVRRERLLEAVDASERTVDLIRTQYLSGLTDFLNLLDAQRTLATQQDAYAESEGLVVQNLIALNRALGGGWELPAPETTPKENAEEITSTIDDAGSEP